VNPNTPLLIGKGVSAIAYSNGVENKFKEIVEKIFNSSGVLFNLTE